MRERLKAIIAEAKSVPCVDCGQQFPTAAMDFDHVRGEKKYQIASMPFKGFSEEALLEEIAKCDVRCAVCHRLRHNED